MLPIVNCRFQVGVPSLRRLEVLEVTRALSHVPLSDSVTLEEARVDLYS